MTRNHLIYLLALAMVFLLMGCGEEVRQYEVGREKPPVAEPASTGAAYEQSHRHRPFDFNLPEGWREKEASGMRFASFTDASAKIDGSIVQLGPMGGDLADNVNRWREQAGLERLEGTLAVESLQMGSSPAGKFQYVELLAEAEELPSILAAIYSLKDSVVFVKLSGPRASIEDVGDEFLALCQSLRPHTH